MRKYVPLDVSVLLPPSAWIWSVCNFLEIRKIRQVGLCVCLCICLCFGVSRSQLSPHVCVCLSPGKLDLRALHFACSGRRIQRPNGELKLAFVRQLTTIYPLQSRFDTLALNTAFGFDRTVREPMLFALGWECSVV